MPLMRLAPWQAAVILNPYDHFAFYGGVAAGKTFTGSQFSIKMIQDNPEMTGFIGANTYDQLSQATLREFFYWLEEYGYEFVVDRRPPIAWGYNRTLKQYNNTVHVRSPKTGKVTLVFTRVLSDENPLRGIEFSWYWLDETRDTPEITHDVVLSRMRETPDFMKGLITTTTNGEDWSYKRFVRGQDESMTYGCCHVKSEESLKLGIITQKYYDTMRKSYSPLMAQQELDAQHVNILGGKAYYAASERNRRRISPWGATVPDRSRPLVIGCDFNFSPAPCVWMVGQIGPSEFSPDGKIFYGDCIHWFGEISNPEVSTPQMTYDLLQQYPNFFYQVFGDVSGGVGTTSNAGETDYHQMGNVFSEAEVEYSIDYFMGDQKQNPKVRSRVENMNARFCNAMGEIHQTYDPVNCPLFDGDIKMVGWKPTTMAGRGKLDDGGDSLRTHATDGAGYAIWKLFPPTRVTEIIESVQSSLRAEYGLTDDNLDANVAPDPRSEI